LIQRTFESIEIGDKESLIRTVSERDVFDFAELSGDVNPLHVDQEYAATTSFKDRVVHGMFGAGLISNVIGMKLPGSGALWMSQNLEFVSPIRIGDTLTVDVVVIKKHSRDNSIEVQAEITNQSNTVVTRGRGRVVVASQKLSGPEYNNTTSNPTVLITGASGDIGLALTQLFLAADAKVVGHYFSSQERLLQLKQRPDEQRNSLELIRGDLTTDEGVGRFLAEATSRFSEVDVIVNIASPNMNRLNVDEISWKDISNNFRSQIEVPIELAKIYLPKMKSKSFGRIIGVSTQIAHGTPRAGQLQYILGKNGQEALMRQIAVEYGAYGITANCVAPGMTDTGFIADLSERARILEAQNTPTKRLATVDDVAETILYLASQKSGQVNGQTIHISGGAVM
jgi:3-oxoacyl-[acyl-carrier protein] reductase